MSTTTQWVAEEEKRQRREKAIVTKAREVEKERMDRGWQYVELTKQMKILVPCDIYGNPTKKGLERMEERRKSLCVL